MCILQGQSTSMLYCIAGKFGEHLAKFKFSDLNAWHHNNIIGAHALNFDWRGSIGDLYLIRQGFPLYGYRDSAIFTLTVLSIIRSLNLK